MESRNPGNQMKNNHRGQGQYLPLLNDFHAQAYAGLQFAADPEIRTVQNRLFLDHVSYTLSHSKFYRETYEKAGIHPKDIQSLSDLSNLPLTTKSDLEDTGKLCCVEQKDIVDICLTSGTSGSGATMIPLTGQDLSRLAYNEEIALGMTGINASDTLVICAALDRCFMAGMAYFLGGAKLSATMVRAGSGSAAQHWEVIKRTHATAIVGVPSLIHKIGEFALAQQINPAHSKVTKLIAIGEPTKDKDMALLPISRELETMWNSRIFSTYASSEMATTFCECGARQGGHLRPELIVVEILDPKDRPVPDGEPGEVVVTPLGITGMPLIRFRTGDISYFIPEPCACGRTPPRLAPVIGRKNQMLKYKGTTLFPNAVLAALEGDSRFHGGYMEARMNPDGTDRAILFASVKENTDPKDLSWLKEQLRATVRVVPEIKIISPEQADERVYQFHKKRKRITFFDLRQG